MNHLDESPIFDIVITGVCLVAVLISVYLVYG